MGPLCKVCGKPVPKETTTHNFGTDRTHAWAVAHPEKPATRAEAQRLVNGQILSVRMTVGWAEGPSYVESANVWDGESYAWGGHFHAQGCAAQFGRAMAAQFPDYAMPAYREAMAERAPKEGAQ